VEGGLQNIKNLKAKGMWVGTSFLRDCIKCPSVIQDWRISFNQVRKNFTKLKFEREFS
jgi:hypothetical protein